MAHRYGERRQSLLFPPSIEDYISKDDAVRAYDAFVDALDWDALNIQYSPFDWALWSTRPNCQIGESLEPVPSRPELTKAPQFAPLP
jgi:hypothetical protein